MNGRSGLSPQTMRAAERPPANFEGLNTVVTAVDEFTVTRSLACLCGSGSGRVAAGEASSEAGWLDPMTWACSACGTSRTFFDSSRDGYDGRFGLGTSHNQNNNLKEIGCPGCGAESLRVECHLAYNIDALELEEDLGPDKFDQLSDYFDALNVNAECASCHHKFNIGSWELA